LLIREVNNISGYVLRTTIVLIAVWMFTLNVRAGETNSADVVVYGSTPGGFCAAIAAAREGASVILLEPTGHIGGMNTGGLSFSDSNQMYRETLMGLFHEWHLRIQQDYEDRGITLPYDVNVKDQSNWSYEPHIAMQVTTQMLAEAGVQVLTRRWLGSVNKIGARIESLVTTSNDTFVARTFVDGSYEGDLMAAAGVSWTIGREGTADFGESLAGKRYPKGLMNIDGVDGGGDPLPLITTTNAGPTDAADDNIMTYSYRLSLTTSAANKIPMPAPDNYDPARFEVMRRYVQAGGSSIGFDRYSVPGGKVDGNNSIGRQFSLGLVGGGNGWATADESERTTLFEAYKQYTLEFLYFLSNDPVFSASQRASNAAWGLCADEFPDTDHFSPYLYVRESRRMQGMYVVSQSDIIGDPVKSDPIMISSFPIDSHDCQRIAYPDGGVRNEGTIFPVRQNGRGYPYQVPYRAILPVTNECDNLLVPVALSCTHVAISSLRIEATWMLLGQSAGIAAAMAADQDIAVQDLPYEDLKRRLIAQGQVLDLPLEFAPLTGIVLDDPDAELAGSWGTSTTITPYVGEGYRYTGAAGVFNDGSATATFRFTATTGGIYQLNMAYTPDPTRATNVPLTVASGPHVTHLSVDQTVARPAGSVLRSLGTVELATGADTVITIGTSNTTGFVILDAIQLVLATPDGGLGWFSPGVSNITADSTDAYASLYGTNAEVTLYWKAGTSAPEEHTGWDGTNATPGLTNSPGRVERAMSGLQPDTRYSCIFHATNSTISTEAWSSAVVFSTALTAGQTPAFTSAVATAGSITLGWEDNASNETGYVLMRSTNFANGYAMIGELEADTIFYADNALSTSGTYYYRLAATNAGNGSVTEFSACQTNASMVVVEAVVSTNYFQEGVAPTSAYSHDAVYIRSGFSEDNFNGDSDQELLVGFTQTPDELRSLLAFDISTIPFGSQVDKASLVLRTEAPQGGLGGTITINVYAYDFDIDETSATWIAPGTGDTTAGGTLGTLLSSATFDATEQSMDVTFGDSVAFRAAVANALAGDGSLRFVLARSDSSSTGNRFARFDDESVATAGNRPELRVTHRSVVDTDGDGIPDALDPDDDNDGTSDEDEAVAGTDPLDESSLLFLAIYPTGSDSVFRIEFPSVSNHDYSLKSRSQLDAGIWSNAFIEIPGDGSVIEIQVTNTYRTGFYQLGVE